MKTKSLHVAISETNSNRVEYLKEKYGTEYNNEIKTYYKLHMIISNAKNLYIHTVWKTSDI